MPERETLNKIFQILNEEFEIAGNDLTPDTSLREDLDLDSLGVIRLVMELNKVFAIEIKSSEISPENFASLTAIEKFINTKVNR